MIARADGSLYIYYASSDTRLHVAETTRGEAGRLLPEYAGRPADQPEVRGAAEQADREESEDH